MQPSEGPKIPEKLAIPVDPREYFKLTMFQKVVEEMDPDKTHPWSAVRSDHLFFENSFGNIFVGGTYDRRQPYKKRPGLLIFVKGEDGTITSTYNNDLDQNQRGAIVDILNLAVPHLPGSQAHEFARLVIEDIQNLDNIPNLTSHFAAVALDLVPDNAEPLALTNLVGRLKLPTEPTDQQSKEMEKFLGKIARKVDRNLFEQKLEELQGWIGHVDEPLGRNYGLLFSDSLKWLFETRGMERNYQALKRRRLKDYPIKDKVTNPIASSKELLSVLEAVPIETMPRVEPSSQQNPVAELVVLDKVVGGAAIKNWLVSETKGRGPEQIFKLVQAFQNDTTGKAIEYEPLEVFEVNDKYFVEGDGRHRAAALKALGVAEVPMMVTHLDV